MTTSALTKVSEQLCFGGKQIRFTHQSAVTNCEMQFSVFLPPQAQTGKVPALYWLSGLTCTDENFSGKAGAQRVAAELGIALIIPDTSPRGDGVPDDPDGAYDFGLGAGFYVNATREPFVKHYQMYDYIVSELPALVEAELPVSAVRAISGHSMGGHGALVIGLRNPERYRSISAFSPIGNPAKSPWGIKAFSGYLGDDQSQWVHYDASVLLAKTEKELPILVDQGLADNFYPQQLRTEALIAAAEQSGAKAQIRLQDGYDHSYYFIASFIEQHLRFHAKYLAN
ncbi:S-formylglutathione hydrolase [Arsukibacterium tuosuense]|uniref:S-formylglutathione hydrolase n=1 Tax=Arsukibacterium tuosuense TaxID=1323745 RepID=A0A285ISR3_9GAMM|nr:S-formylglutathione hydrolase [Arsukibacterium tuosuense]SNY51014.1 S-formylglutathione hydrolase [Arsukibacterium tuosuense]